MVSARIIPEPQPACLDWLKRFATEPSGVSDRRNSTSELHRHLRQFYDSLTTQAVQPLANRAEPSPSSALPAETQQFERTALINGVGEMIYVVGHFANSPSLSDLWLRGQVRRLLDGYQRLHKVCA
jgi:hypothetical protein